MQLLDLDTCKGSSADPAVVAMLVHGTWARNAEWCRDGSDFCQHLSHNLGGSVKFDVFRWSGWNLHRARIIAGSRLASRISRVISMHPKARILLIGHSHGGNLIRYALTNPDIASRVTGVVTLATPFIALATRPFQHWLYLMTKAFAASALALSVLIAPSLLIEVIVFLDEFMKAMYSANLPVKVILRHAFLPSIIGIFALLVGLYVARIGRFVAAVENKLAPLQAEMIAAIDPPVIDGIPLLSIEVRADEARFALAAASFCSEWAYKTVSNTFVNGFLLVILLPIATMYLFPINRIFWMDFPYVTSLCVVFVVVPLLVGSLLFLSILVPRAIKAPIFGEQTIFEAWLLRSIQSPKPVGWLPYTHRQFVVKTKWWHSWRTLRHSLVYGNPEVANSKLDESAVCG
jgi:pimeloyl-ACP methyl ester carboxylesterase